MSGSDCINIVTNNAMRVSKDFETQKVLAGGGSITIITRTADLLALPNQSSLVIIDYRTGFNPECVCEVARLMVRRGDFVEVESLEFGA